MDVSDIIQTVFRQPTLEERINAASLVVRVLTFPLFVMVGIYCFLHLVGSEFQNAALGFACLILVAWFGFIWARTWLIKQRVAGQTFTSRGGP